MKTITATVFRTALVPYKIKLTLEDETFENFKAHGRRPTELFNLLCGKVHWEQQPVPDFETQLEMEDEGVNENEYYNVKVIKQ